MSVSADRLRRAVPLHDNFHITLQATGLSIPSDEAGVGETISLQGAIQMHVKQQPTPDVEDKENGAVAPKTLQGGTRIKHPALRKRKRGYTARPTMPKGEAHSTLRNQKRPCTGEMVRTVVLPADTRGRWISHAAV